jgi:hypothetical protein
MLTIRVRLYVAQIELFDKPYVPESVNDPNFVKIKVTRRVFCVLFPNRTQTGSWE